MAEKEMNNNAYILKAIVKQLEDKYDRIIIDSAPTVNLLVLNVINAADEILIPCKMDIFSVKGCFQTINYINQLTDVMEQAGLLVKKTDYKVFTTMVKKNMNISKTLYSVLEDVLGDHLLKTQIRAQDSAVLKSNSGQGHFALAQGSKRSKIADDYVGLVQEVETSMNKGEN